MDNSPETTKKIPIENLPKEEIIKKYQDLIILLKKAMQNKELLTKENITLKEKLDQSNPAITNELVETLTQQKLALVTNLEEVKSQKDNIHLSLKKIENQLNDSENKVNELDIENKSFQRQIKRLTEENEQLLLHLDSLEKEQDQSKNKDVEAQQKFLEIEKSDLSKELLEKEKIISELQTNNKDLTIKYGELKQNIETLEKNYQNAEVIICELKDTIKESTQQREVYLSESDDLNVELHKNKAMVEKLQHDLKAMSSKLSNNQIELSGYTSDLQNKNEKLKDKLKQFHSKIVKFATDVKMLKQDKTNILEGFKNYVEQGKTWESQLKDYANRMFMEFQSMEVEYHKLKEENENTKIRQAAIESELELKDNALIQNQKLLEEKTSQCESQVQNINELNTLIIELKSQLEQANSIDVESVLIESQNMKVQCCKMKEEFESTKITMETELKMKDDTLLKNQQILEDKIVQCDSQIKSITELNDLIVELKSRLDRANCNEEDLNNEISNLFEKNKTLMDTIAQMKVNQSTCEVQVNIPDEQLANIKRENVELLAEMNEMNQALKTRGEAISKQQEYCDELLGNIKHKEVLIKEHLQTIQNKNELINNLEMQLCSLRNQSEVKINEKNDTQQIIEKKDMEIMQLQKEIVTLQENLNVAQSLNSSQEVNYPESETMSTSTISKNEEFNRLKDLEGSWEERYGKLRTLALKLKGKIRDLTVELNKEQNEKLELQHKLTDSIKTSHTIHTQCDKLQDELDESKGKVKDFLKKLDLAALDISNSKKQLAENDEVITKLKQEIEILNKEKSNTDTWKKQISAKVQSLRKELDANNLLKKDFENQIAKLNQQLENTEKLLKEETEKHNTTRNSLQESNNECKKQTVLNLEMQDYERSLKDLTQKLDKRQELINKLKNQIDSQKSTVNLIKEENKNLEERLQNGEQDLNVAQSEVLAYKKTIGDLDTIIMQKDEKIQNLIETLENSRVENENLSSQLSKIISENQKICNNLKAEKDYLRGQNLGLEDKLRDISESLRLRENELTEINKEYQGYKVRAQSVLRQNQTRDIGLEEKLTEEVASFKTQTAVLTTELNSLRNQLEKLSEENTTLKTEQEQLINQQMDLTSNLNEKEKQYEALTGEYQNSITEHAEAIRGLKIHAETLAQCYRQQLSEQEVRHNREIIELQSKIDKGPSAVDLSPVVLPTIIREQGEGSENVDANYTHPIPLNRLLSSESDNEVDFLKKQANDNETKIIHLTALLADTEQDLAKHVQMNKLLKEEIRRQQRSVEREKHADNLEYLKNVVFKFATLNSGDERSRLVPVLNTILKFSPEEIHKLNLVARSEFGNRGWTNYIPMWSNKPQ